MKTITIIGFGRFGKTLHRLVKDDFKITLHDIKPIEISDNKTIVAKNLEEAYKSEAIFYCIPISEFEKTINEHKKHFKPNHLLIDVLSVKLHPATVLNKALKEIKTQAMLTHPMFGPDSTKESFEGLTIVLDKFKASEENYNFWKNYFKNKKLNIVELSPEKHDKIAANTQGLTHFIGRLLEELDFKETSISSAGAKKLLQVKEQTCNDTWQLFNDLQHFNPFTKKMRIDLGKIYDKLYNKLLPKQINPNAITYGIQGGEGSFNEEAILNFITKNKIKNYKIKYLYTSEKVLKALHEGNIDYGLFAIQNAAGGIVHESFHAMANYKFKIVEELQIVIRHFLMKRKEIPTEKITTIMAHPQNFRQCKNSLKKYPNLEQKSGEGDLVDTARAAFYLAKDKLPKNIAILGPKTLSQKYGLEIMDENLQDIKDNLTTFLLVGRE